MIYGMCPIRILGVHPNPEHQIYKIFIHLPAASSRGTKFVDLLLRRQFEHVVGSLLDYLKL